MAEKKKATLTTASGSPVADNQNSLTAGPRGPILVQDGNCLKNTRTSTGSGSRNGWFTPKDRPLTARSPSPTIYGVMKLDTAGAFLCGHVALQPPKVSS